MDRAARRGAHDRRRDAARRGRRDAGGETRAARRGRRDAGLPTRQSRRRGRRDGYTMGAAVSCSGASRGAHDWTTPAASPPCGRCHRAGGGLFRRREAAVMCWPCWSLRLFGTGPRGWDDGGRVGGGGGGGGGGPPISPPRSCELEQPSSRRSVAAAWSAGQRSPCLRVHGRLLHPVHLAALGRGGAGCRLAVRGSVALAVRGRPRAPGSAARGRLLAAAPVPCMLARRQAEAGARPLCWRALC